MKKLFVIFFVLFSGCYYGGSTVECESLLDTSSYVCSVSNENTDVCFDVIFENGAKENRCVESKESKEVSMKFDTESGIVVETKITNENLCSYIKVKLTTLSILICVIFTTASFIIAFNNFNTKHYTITLIFICLLFNLVGVSILYLIDKTREEMKDRKKPQK
jgi:hypothetical protein